MWAEGAVRSLSATLAWLALNSQLLGLHCGTTVSDTADQPPSQLQHGVESSAAKATYMNSSDQCKQPLCDSDHGVRCHECCTSRINTRNCLHPVSWQAPCTGCKRMTRVTLSYNHEHQRMVRSPRELHDSGRPCCTGVWDRSRGCLRGWLRRCRLGRSQGKACGSWDQACCRWCPC